MGALAASPRAMTCLDYPNLSQCPSTTTSQLRIYVRICREFGAFAYAFQMDSCPGMDIGLL